ncbi:MAG: Hsp70 family protein [Deltaproteobacteria bacterium]|nr:Hsp70 family protein [Deltaproteobacteria bacterium]
MKRIVGIDFGTTFTRISVIKDGKPILIPVQSEHGLLPSMVLYTPSKTILVGQKAQDHYFLYPKSGVLHVKRYVGQNIQFTLNGRTFSAEELSTYIFKEIKTRAESFLGEVLTQAVVTVPTYFNHFQRQGIQQAAEAAGFQVLQLLNEPTAAALAYHLDQTPQAQKIMVCDLGGGTFDIAILEMDQEFCKVRSSSGDSHLGGVEWDRALYRFFEQRITTEFGLRALFPPFVKDKLWKHCEKLKEALSSQEKAVLSTPILSGERGFCLKNYSYTMTQAEYGMLTQPLVERLSFPIKRALSMARLGAQELDAILLVGGTTFNPHIRSHLERLLGRPLYTGIDPERIVVYGAAWRAAHLEGSQSCNALKEVIPLSLRMKINQNPSFTLIRKNTPIPIRQSQSLMIKDPLEVIDIQLHQGVYEIMKEDYLMARINLKSILPTLTFPAQILISVEVDENGLIAVTIQDHKTQTVHSVKLENVRSISYRKVALVLEKNKSIPISSLQDWQQRAQHVQELIDLSEKFLNHFSNRLSIKMKQKIATCVDLLKHPTQETSFEALSHSMDHLGQILSYFYGVERAPIHDG